MSYYILPKVVNSYIKINPSLDECVTDTYISHSLFNYYKKMKTQLNNIIDTDVSMNIQNILKIVNPYEFIFSKIPGSNYSVSKLKPQTNIFYDMLEIINMLNIFDNYKNTNIKFITISSSYEDVNCCYYLFRENNTDSIDNHIEFKSNLHEETNGKSYDIIFYEIEKIIYCNLNNYILKLIDTILLILHRQTQNGIAILKIGFTFHKPVVDILYLLSSLYQKVYIVKPNTSNVMSYEKYIVCKNFILNENVKQIYFSYIVKLIEFKNFYTNNSENIKHIIDKDTPYFYINKIDDINNIIGQQQLETIDQVINIYKNKNKDDKIESIKKINIHKSINWCEKMKIPYNKVSEKPNIFLPITNDELEKIDLDESDAENEVIENEVIENLCLVIENELL